MLLLRWCFFSVSQSHLCEPALNHPKMYTYHFGVARLCWTMYGSAGWLVGRSVGQMNVVAIIRSHVAICSRWRPLMLLYSVQPQPFGCSLYERWPRLKNNKHKTFGLRCHFFCFVLYITRKMSGFIFYTNASRVLLRWTKMRIAFIVYPTTRYAHRSCVFFRRYIFWIVCSFPKPALPMLCFVSHRSVSSSSCYRRV